MPAVEIHVMPSDQQRPQLSYKKEEITDALVVYFERTEKGVRKHSHRFLSDEDPPIEVMVELPQLDSKVVVDAKMLSFVTLQYMYKDGQLLMDNSGMPRSYVNSTGYFDKGGGKYVLRTQGKPYFVSAQRIMEGVGKKKRRQHLTNKRKEALKQYASQAKKGDWRLTRLFDFGISFPDHSYWTWEGEGEEPRIVREEVGPQDCLAQMWRGWVPTEPLVPEVGPFWLRKRLYNARKMLEGIKDLESLHLLPEKREQSPLLKLEGEGLKVIRTVEVPSGLMAIG